MNRRYAMAGLVLMAFCCTGSFAGSNAHVSSETRVVDVINAEAFKGFGRFLFPTGFRTPDSSMKLSEISPLLPYHSHINAGTTVTVINAMIDIVASGKSLFYDIYSEQEKKQDASRSDTGLFFFRGEKNAPLAIVCAGGGFSYVGSIHESFPLALELSRKGFNAFAIQYRTGGAEVACQDLARAITFIFRNANSLQVGTRCYSLWGGSAGARMAAFLGSYGPAAFGGETLPRPGTVVMQYTGHSEYARQEPPTFVVVGEQDGIVDWRVMERRILALQQQGTETEFHRFPNLGHGFGLGIGTSADGWVDDAVLFWKRQIQKDQS